MIKIFTDLSVTYIFPIISIWNEKLLILLFFLMEFIQDHVFYITFAKDVEICLLSFFS